MNELVRNDAQDELAWKRLANLDPQTCFNVTSLIEQGMSVIQVVSIYSCAGQSRERIALITAAAHHVAYQKARC
jgi:hypothetical protein